MKLGYFLRRPLQLPIALITRLPYFAFVRGTADHPYTITFETWLRHRLLGSAHSRRAYWPVHPASEVIMPQNIRLGVGVCPGLMPGCYIQGIGGIEIGDFTLIAAGVGIISANHDPHDSRLHISSPVSIGSYCWIGMGAKVMPGVTLGDFTVVAAGAVVTRSFPDGYCVIGGVPARKLREIEPSKCARFSVSHPYHGYLSEAQYEVFTGAAARSGSIPRD